jgi:Dehydrogenases with different specificities (related to short-chain alcohol dehydrogenases)
MLAVTGRRSRIVEELLPLLPSWEKVERIEGEPPLCERYLFCAGVIRPKTLREQTSAEIGETLHVNCIRPIELCDEILERNKQARIVVIGSESGFAWSHDGVYAAAKAALHRYVETKKLSPNQQLVCVAPSIIADTHMTQSRCDAETLERRRQEHPKGRFLKAVEISRLIHFLLYVDEGYLSGQVIRVNGGA